MPAKKILAGDPKLTKNDMLINMRFTQRFKKPLLIIGGIVLIVAVIILITMRIFPDFYANIYDYFNPLDEHSVAFQQYMPTIFPGGAPVALTDAKAWVLKRDARHPRKEWLGWDLDEASLRATLSDSFGRNSMWVAETKGIALPIDLPSQCAKGMTQYHITKNGRAYCLWPKGFNNKYSSTPIVFIRLGSTAIEADIGKLTHAPMMDDFVDSFQKVHLVNMPIIAVSDPMQY